MAKVWIITAIIFLVLSYLLVKGSINYYRKVNSDKMWKSWGMMAVYFEGIAVVSGFLTFVLVALLVKARILGI